MELAALTQVVELVAPASEIAECEDPDDNRILEAAVEGNAGFIVSGDKHLLRMNPFRGIEILTVAAFLGTNVI